MRLSKAYPGRIGKNRLKNGGMKRSSTCKLTFLLPSSTVTPLTPHPPSLKEQPAAEETDVAQPFPVISVPSEKNKEKRSKSASEKGSTKASEKGSTKASDKSDNTVSMSSSGYLLSQTSVVYKTHTLAIGLWRKAVLTTTHQSADGSERTPSRCAAFP